MKQFILITAIVLCGISAHARLWTNTEGKKVDAEVVKVNLNRTVVLRTTRGRTVTVPFNTFITEDVEHLEYLLSRKGRGKLHKVPWNELNTLFGLPIWQDDFLWDDPTADAAKRMGLKKESKTDFMENDSGQNEDTGSGGHICLIIGYNKQKNEIAISDSWGPRFAERWVPVSDAQNVSYGDMNVIKW